MDAIKNEMSEFIIDHPESYCRFCYLNKDLQSIFPSNGEANLRIIVLLQDLVNITLTIDQDFPSAICNQCLLKLEEFETFRTKCRIFSEQIRAKRQQNMDRILSIVKNESIDSDCEERRQPLCFDESFAKTELELECVTEAFVKNEPYIENELSLSSSSPAPQTKNKIRKTGKSIIARMKKKSVTDLKRDKRKNEHKDYRCKICDQFFINKESINFHLKKHMDTVNLRCCYCSKTFSSTYALSQHAITSYILKSFPCQYCDIYFPTKEKLFAHEFYCDKDVPENESQADRNITKAEKCSLCPSKSFDTLHSLQAHMTLHEAKFNCEKCGVDLPSAVLLERHYERYHSQGAKLIASTVTCEPCQRTFIDASAYRSHHTRFHDDQQHSVSRKLDEDKPYECDNCQKRFWSINTIRYHVLVHRQYRDCNLCTESFRSKKELRDHKLFYHPVACEFCSRTFYSEMACRSHCNMIHGMVQVRQLARDTGRVCFSWRKISYKCATCELEYDKFQMLKNHYSKMHSKSKLMIKCTYCNKNSASRIGYVGHLIGNCGQTPKKLRTGSTKI
ncbi:zinc finger protein 888 [Malaya genurostris]|uniref:zinc finger protein 888 n=1 Tax=Malaya genurostris TaxID=325434 RepID=UPI0026F38CFC|nr:zinc finger protein 888 [Malaya genurostris]